MMTITINGKTTITGKTVFGPIPTVTPTISLTPSNTPTPSITPTTTVTTSITPTPTPTPSGVSGDVTPNPTPDWANVAYAEATDDGIVAVQQIQGIDTTITLNISWVTPVRMYYRIDNSAPTWSNGGIFAHYSPVFGTFTEMTNSAGSTFTVTNNQYVSFVCFIDSGQYGTGLVTVKNQSDGNITLDTFVWDVAFLP